MHRKTIYIRTVIQQKPITHMLEFCKEILTKVSFDRILFRKELRKAIKWLQREELVQLKQWCMDTFGTNYKDIILASFRPIML